MIGALLLILILLWVFGYVHVSGITIPDLVLFTINGQVITLWNILILLVIAWLIGILPRPFREIASVLLVLWVLSVLGVLAIAGLSNIIIIAVIVGIIVYLVGGSMERW